MHMQTSTFVPFRLDARERQLLADARLTLDFLMRAACRPQLAELPVMSGFRPADATNKIANRSLTERNGTGTLSQSTRDMALETPEILRQFIQEQVDHLPPAEREIVEAASVAGIEFCASQVAAALNRPGPGVEMRCATMAQGGQFFGTFCWSESPHGAIRPRYRFVHSLYRETIYKRLPAGRRARWHLRIGERLELDRGGAEQKKRAAAELAHHFRLGRDARRAIHYCKEAAQQCLERGAARDTVFQIISSLKLLRRIPEQKERKQLVLELEALYRKARDLMENSLSVGG